MSKIEWIDLKDFITKTIVDIDKWLKDASEETQEEYLFTTKWTDEKNKWCIHFDLTVYSEQTKDRNSWWKIKVCWLWEVWIIWNFKKKNYTTSNIKFSVSRMWKNKKSTKSKN